MYYNELAADATRRRIVMWTARRRYFALSHGKNALQDRLFVRTQNVDSLQEQAGSRKIIHMHGELFKSRCHTCSRPPFDDTNLYEPPASAARKTPKNCSVRTLSLTKVTGE